MPIQLHYYSIAIPPKTLLKLCCFSSINAKPHLIDDQNRNISFTKPIQAFYRTIQLKVCEIRWLLIGASRYHRSRINMFNPHRHTLMEIEARSAKDVVASQIAKNEDILGFLRSWVGRTGPTSVITCARGSSDHAATYLRYILETRAGVLSTSLAPSVASLYGKWPYVAGSLCVAISQSGASSDLLSVVEGYAKAGVSTIALLNDCESPLAGLAEMVVPLHAGQERSVAATKSFIGSMFAALQVADCLQPGLASLDELRSLPDKLEEAWAIEWLPLIEALVNAEGLYVIGRGIGLSAAGEAALKFKETCKLHAESYSAAEVRHGPMALFNNDFPILIFRQNDASAKGVDELTSLAVESGCKVFVVGGNTVGATNLATVNVSALLSPITQIQTFYRAVNALALARGCDPDHPPLLNKVTVTL
jgi:glutamine---fructose-6-phosphate transaminase (isomerizing)